MGDGAPNTVTWLTDHGVKLDLVLDEGGAVIEAPMPGLNGKYAMLGVLEKGYADVRFTAVSAGGHSSTPPKGTPLARLAAFVNRWKPGRRFQVKITPPVKAMFAAMAPDMAFPFRLLFGNLWLFGPLLKRVIPKVSGQAGALLHTTCAFTMAQGSDAPNVIPAEASVTAICGLWCIRDGRRLFRRWRSWRTSTGCAWRCCTPATARRWWMCTARGTLISGSASGRCSRRRELRRMSCWRYRRQALCEGL